MVELLLTLLLLNPTVSVKTTGYCPGPPCVDAKWADGKTASNTPVRVGVCAADWSVFPKGTVVKIPHYGFCRVEDTGSAVKGLHLDLFFETEAEARQWGVQQHEVVIVEWPQ